MNGVRVSSAFLGVLVALGLSISLAAAEDCVSVTVADRFTLPDGSVHDAARLSLCTQRSLSPVAGIHEIAVDGIPMGMAISRVGRSEGPGSPTPMVLFRRASSGLLDVVGFSVPDGNHARTFLLRGPTPPPAANVAVQTVRAVEVEAPHNFGPVALRRAAD